VRHTAGERICGAMAELDGFGTEAQPDLVTQDLRQAQNGFENALPQCRAIPGWRRRRPRAPPANWFANEIRYELARRGAVNLARWPICSMMPARMTAMRSASERASFWSWVTYTVVILVRS